MAVDDEVVVGYPVEKVLFQKKADETINSSLNMAKRVWGGGVSHRESELCSYFRQISARKKRFFGTYLISTFCFPIKMMLRYFLLPDKFRIQSAFLINIISVFP